jgi:hypothetical protein
LSGIKHRVRVSGSSSKSELKASSLNRQAEEPDRHQDNRYLIKLKVGHSTGAGVKFENLRVIDLIPSEYLDTEASSNYEVNEHP